MNKKRCCIICGNKVEYVLSEIKGRYKSVVLCANHMMTDIDKALSMEPMTDMCECCGEVREVFIINTSQHRFQLNTGQHHFQLCRKHLIDLIHLCLDSESYKKLVESVKRQDGKFEYYLHDDFYSDQGDAYQPEYDSARALYSRWGIDAANICIDSLIEHVRVLMEEAAENGYGDDVEKLLEKTEEILLCQKK